MKTLTVLSIRVPLLLTILAMSACDRSNIILLGRVETKIAAHQVVVTDCYKTSVPEVEKLGETSEGGSTYRWKPCRDAEIIIRAESLVVNGRLYGRLNPDDAVTVDHGRVLVNDRAAVAMTR
jgi:hypothetical protein